MSIPSPILIPINGITAEAISQQLVAMTPWYELGYQAKTLERYFLSQAEGFTSLVLTINQQPAGIITLRSPWLRGTLLELIAILPVFQHQGLGLWLMNWLHEYAQQRQQRNIWTLASAFNQKALQFYQTQGFKIVGQLDDFIIQGQNELLLRLRLD